MLAEESELLRDALGEYTLNSFIRNKKIEWEEYRATVTKSGLSTCLKAFLTTFLPVQRSKRPNASR